ncbi:MAG TPA: ArsA family ATPase, partial [Calditrichia bacterium]|nr:ArsA family ATPase [Calditrichia bacterium]
IDSAPTGETLTFLTLPQVTEWWLTKAFPFQKLAIQAVGGAVRKTTGIPLDKGYNELKALFEKLQDIQKVLSDPAISSIRLVMNPEKMVIQEARRAYTYLQLYGYGVDCVIVNRIMPERAAPGGWEAYLEAQKKYLGEIEASFSPLPIFKVSHLQREVFGLALLKEIGGEIYHDQNPAEIFYKDPTYQVIPDGDNYELRIHLPNIESAAVEVRQYGDQLVIQIANQRRNYLLPRFLTYFQAGQPAMDDGWLLVPFTKKD